MKKILSIMRNKLAENLVFLRKEKKLNQLMFSSWLNIKRSTYANWESGHSEPPISALQHISSIMGITIDDLLNKQLSEGKVSEIIPENEIGKVSGKVSGKVLPEYHEILGDYTKMRDRLILEAEKKDQDRENQFELDDETGDWVKKEISKIWSRIENIEKRLAK
jgi:transcriptional regulator with XRE-family HTH domain